MRLLAVFFACFTVCACGNVDTADHQASGSTMAADELVRVVKVVPASSMDLAVDKATIVSSELSGNKLYLTVRYGGGSREHDFELYCIDALAKSMPPKASLHLSHNANGDMAKALVTKQLVFELAPMDVLTKGPISLNIFPPGERQPISSHLLYTQ